jgi:transcription-repair coupling factor (superfamily II helicase)
VVDELTDRYGAPPDPVRNLVAVAAFRHRCRQLRVTEVATAGSSIRLSPVDLPESAQMRLRRLHPRSTYKATAKTIVVPRPSTGASSGGQRMGASPMRDTELLDWCFKLLTDAIGPTA